MKNDQSKSPAESAKQASEISLLQAERDAADEVAKAAKILVEELKAKLDLVPRMMINAVLDWCNGLRRLPNGEDIRSFMAHLTRMAKVENNLSQPVAATTPLLVDGKPFDLVAWLRRFGRTYDSVQGAITARELLFAAADELERGRTTALRSQPATSPAKIAPQSTDSLKAVTIYIPSGYKDAAEFLEDCGFSSAIEVNSNLWSAETHDQIIRRLMTNVGMPNSTSLYSAFKQFANELYALSTTASQSQPESADKWRKAIGAKAREWAGHYKEASDGRNTFIMFAEWVEALELPQ